MAVRVAARSRRARLRHRPRPEYHRPRSSSNSASKRRLDHHIQDIRERGALSPRIIREARPDFLFHLAAQPLVRLSYEQPVETWETNVLGTIHVLEALRALDHPCAALFITTDKCYENREWLYAYRESDPLGGHDPYSSSKAGAEIAVAAWRRSFFQDSPVKIATARAGNVIGGGDWALDRIVPDAMRALARGEAIPVRNKTSTRPWQHVLEPLGGYLWLAALLAGPRSPASRARALHSATPSISARGSSQTARSPSWSWKSSSIAPANGKTAPTPAHPTRRHC